MCTCAVGSFWCTGNVNVLMIVTFMSWGALYRVHTHTLVYMNKFVCPLC